MPIEVLLTQSVEKLGEPGDIVRVADGYARNYLFPKNVATLPTPHNVNRFKKVRDARELELKKREEWAKSVKTKVDGFVLTFQRKSHDEGKLYSTVRREEIVEQIQQQLGIEIEKDRVGLGAHQIETLGTHPVKLALYKDIAASIRVVVEEEKHAS
ncbi:50S ribosomal protein L9 [Candidatus Acetothermia bacterium]|nr:50S ribosomal protein L9 [Candidatus Acetothermia bacterium]MBI3460459.1 50S ribosomal protein L9 [Candidatus Acetothermia bacterium]MBI3660923.1 50S ribosomal protein L9 [Candidatus Acetothermia bacterium]